MSTLHMPGQGVNEGSTDPWVVSGTGGPTIDISDGAFRIQQPANSSIIRATWTITNNGFSSKTVVVRVGRRLASGRRHAHGKLSNIHVTGTSLMRVPICALGNYFI